MGWTEADALMVRNLAREDIGTILDHFSDVIEGGNAYNAGTAFNGIAGLYSNDEKTRSGLSITASSAGSTTTVPYASGAYAADEWGKSNTPGFFAISTSGDNDGYGRPITTWNNTTKIFTVSPPFTYAVPSGGTFTFQQGFKRFPEGLDFDADGHEAASGYDRMFAWEVAGEGEEVPFYGSGVANLKMLITLQLRLLKYGREGVRIRKSAITNMAILRRGLVAPGNRGDGVYVRMILPSGGSSIENHTHRIVIKQTFEIIYRVDTTI